MSLPRILSNGPKRENPEPEECDICDGVYTDDGHEEDCRKYGKNMNDLEEDRRSARAEDRLEEQKLEELSE